MNGEHGSLDEWLHYANQDCMQSIAADTDVDRAFSFVTFIAGVRCEALTVSVKRSLARPVIEAYESIDRSMRPTNSKGLIDGLEGIRVSPVRAPEGQWDLVHAARDGDRSAFARLFDRYVDVVFRYVLFRVEDRQLAEDVTSETFLRGLRRIESVTYQGRDVGAWFVTIARNLVLDHVKSNPVRGEVTAAEIDDSGRVDAGPEQQVIADVTRSVLLECVRQLGGDQRECIVLRFLQGLSVAETAKVMTLNEGAVKALQHRAVRRLAQLLPPDLR